MMMGQFLTRLSGLERELRSEIEHQCEYHRLAALQMQLDTARLGSGARSKEFRIRIAPRAPSRSAERGLLFASKLLITPMLPPIADWQRNPAQTPADERARAEQYALAVDGLRRVVDAMRGVRRPEIHVTR